MTILLKQVLTSSSGSLRLGLGDGNAGFNFSSHHYESLLNILAVLSRSFKEAHIVMLSELLSLIGGDLASVCHIALVAN